MYTLTPVLGTQSCKELQLSLPSLPAFRHNLIRQWMALSNHRQRDLARLRRPPRRVSHRPFGPLALWPEWNGVCGKQRRTRCSDGGPFSRDMYRKRHKHVHSRLHPRFHMGIACFTVWRKSRLEERELCISLSALMDALAPSHIASRRVRRHAHSCSHGPRASTLARFHIAPATSVPAAKYRPISSAT